RISGGRHAPTSAPARQSCLDLRTRKIFPWRSETPGSAYPRARKSAFPCPDAVPDYSPCGIRDSCARHHTRTGKMRLSRFHAPATTAILDDLNRTILYTDLWFCSAVPLLIWCQPMHVLTEAEVHRLLDPLRVAEAIEAAFRHRYPTTIMPTRT